MTDEVASHRSRSKPFKGPSRLLTTAAGLTVVVFVSGCGTVTPGVGHLGTAIVGTPASEATPSAASPSRFLFTIAGHTDFYTWYGLTLSRRDDALPADDQPQTASADGQYFVDRTGRIWNTDGGVKGTVADWAKGSWAPPGIDGHLCGTVKDAAGSYSLEVVDVQGKAQHYELGTVGPVAPFGCNQTTGDAAVLEAEGNVMAVIALSDGHTERRVSLGDYNQLVPSSDLRWLAVSHYYSAAKQETDVVDLSSGQTVVTLTDRTPVAFSPDDRLLVVNDAKAATVRALDWQANTEVWSRQGGAMGPEASDLSTDKVLIVVGVGSAMAGTETDTYWVVDGQGAAVQFMPHA